MALHVAFCVFDPILNASFSSVQLHTVQALSVTIRIFFFTLYEMVSSESSESNDDDCPHLMFTVND